jgi:hypothetical protein
MAELFGGTLGIVLIVLGIIWGVLLLFLPFIIFGISSTLKRIEVQAIQINARLAQANQRHSDELEQEKPLIAD